MSLQPTRLRMRRWVGPLLVVLGVLLLDACSSGSAPRSESPNRQNPRLSAPPTPDQSVVVAATPTQSTATVAIPGVKLDLGIDVFDPNVEKLDPDQTITTPSVRRAEARYLPKILADTLRQRGVWNSVRVIPQKQSERDLWVDGRILHSDGTTLDLEITVTDATGKPWYTRNYRESVERYAYDRDPTAPTRDPFHLLYERIADDLQREAARQPPGVLQEAHALSELQFAQRFDPARFDPYLKRDQDGRTRVARLPAAEDPATRRMTDLRARDLAFVDQVDAYVTDYAASMQSAYDRWREESHTEVSSMKSLQTSAALRKLGGALALLGGVAVMALANDSSASAAGLAGAAGGAYLYGTGVEKSREAKTHSAALEELATSFGTDMKSRQVTLNDRTVTLAGSVDEQYAQWRAILAELYQHESAEAAGLPRFEILATPEP